jgi:hypothetical protein
MLTEESQPSVQQLVAQRGFADCGFDYAVCGEQFVDSGKI